MHSKTCCLSLSDRHLSAYDYWKREYSAARLTGQIVVLVKCVLRGVNKMRKIKCGMEDAECMWLVDGDNHVTVHIPQYITSAVTLCGFTIRKTHRGGLGLGGSVHEEAHPCFPHLVQPSFEGIDAGSIYHPLVQLISSINHSIWKNTYSSPCAPKLN